MELSQFLKEIDGNSLCFVSPREQAKRSSIGKKLNMIDRPLLVKSGSGFSLHSAEKTVS